MDAVRTPLASVPALALGNRRYRKQVLTLGKIYHGGGVFDVTPEYIDSVVTAFDSKAIARVPFQLADAANSHTEDPLRRFGSVEALHRTPEGLDAVIELDEDAARLVDKDPEFGVSVLVKHNRTTGDGRRFPAVLAHVLGTTDPVLSLTPWREELAASHAAEDTLDLLALTPATEPADALALSSAFPAASGDTSSPKEGSTMADSATLAPEELAALRSLASVAPQLVQLATAPQDSADDTDPADTDGDQTTDDAVDEALEMTEADIKALADLIDLDDEQDTQPLAASHDGNAEMLALSQRLDEAEQARRDQALALAQLRDERDETRYSAQRDQWARKYGVHPSVTDIVKPLLKGGAGQKLALANGGGDVDPAALIAKFVHEIATRPRLDLSQAKGQALDVEDDEDAKRDADNKAFFEQVRATRNG